MTEPLFPAMIVAIEFAAEDILSFTLRPQDGALPKVIDPGSHLDVHLPNGMMRSYSLSNGPYSRRDYRLTVARDANSRGGSNYMHDNLRVGQVLQISQPRNNFELATDAATSVFFAGGIGVTPFLPMIGKLNDLGRKWRLYYCARNRERAALVDELAELEAAGHGTVVSHYDDENGLFDLRGTLSALGVDAHVYCCGPKGMLDAFRSGANDAGFASQNVHFEYFNADIEAATQGGFVIGLQRSGRDINVSSGQTILQALVENGINIPYSCEEGICGACETRVVEGTPDHRDMILSDDEKRQNQTIMVCCSGSLSKRLVLDL